MITSLLELGLKAFYSTFIQKSYLNFELKI